MVAAGGPLVEYLGCTMHPRHADLARSVISGRAPLDTLRLRKRLARMLKVDETPAESANAPQVYHSTINAVLRPICPMCLSPHCQADRGRQGAKDQVRLFWALPQRPTEVVPNMSGTGNELWVGLMVWASGQVGGASMGVPVTPLPKWLPEVQDGPLEALRAAFEACTLPVTMVEAMGELLGDITPSWASSPVLVLLAGHPSPSRPAGAVWGIAGLGSLPPRSLQVFFGPRKNGENGGNGGKWGKMGENGEKRGKTGGNGGEMGGNAGVWHARARLLATVTSLTTHMIATQAFSRRCIQSEESFCHLVYHSQFVLAHGGGTTPLTQKET